VDRVRRKRARRQASSNSEPSDGASTKVSHRVFVIVSGLTEVEVEPGVELHSKVDGACQGFGPDSSHRMETDHAGKLISSRPDREQKPPRFSQSRFRDRIAVPVSDLVTQNGP
jgi:hypothetical protein